MFFVQIVFFAKSFLWNSHALCPAKFSIVFVFPDKCCSDSDGLFYRAAQNINQGHNLLNNILMEIFNRLISIVSKPVKVVVVVIVIVVIVVDVLWII